MKKSKKKIKDISKLIISIFVNPKQAIKDIIKLEPDGFLIFAVIVIGAIYLEYIVNLRSLISLKQIFTLGFISGLIFYFLYPPLINWLAYHEKKYSSDKRRILSDKIRVAAGCSFVPLIISAILILVSRILSIVIGWIAGFIWIISVPISLIWSLIILIKGIKLIYSISTLRAFLAYIIASVAIGVLNIVIFYLFSG